MYLLPKQFFVVLRFAFSRLVTNGGRVLFVTVMADTLKEAQEKANEEIAKIKCENLFHRTDIGWQAIR